MGWSDGSEFAERYIDVCQKYVTNEKERLKLYKDYIDFLTYKDWDTEYETVGLDQIWDEALKWYYIKMDFDKEDWPEGLE